MESKVIIRGGGKAQTTLPEGKIGGDETIFVLNEGAKAQHTWVYVSICGASKVQNLPIETIYRTTSNNLTNK